MKTAQETKDMVRAKYAEIALQDKGTNASSCCGTGGCSTEVATTHATTANTEPVVMGRHLGCRSGSRKYSC